MIRNLSLYAVLTAVWTTVAVAQVATGSIAGAVSDPNGALVPAARVSAVNKTTGIKAETLTTEAGVYVLPSLPVGTYDIEVEKSGFRKAVQPDIEVRVASRLDLNISLQVGDVAQVVDVQAQGILLETSSAQRGSSVSTFQMNTLPLFSGGIRNARNFINYLPGANPSPNTGEISVNGAGARAQEILIDGASATIPESGGTSFNFPSAEMFGEFRMLTSTYDAEYGRFAGGVEIYITKSGTNDIHGSAFLNMRRDIWNANQWANNARGAARAKERYNEMGGAIGGPVYIPKIYNGKNKTFFYFTYSKDDRPVTASQTISTVPTNLMRQGDFSELLASGQIIYDPATTSGTTRQPFPGNIIPQNRWSTISKNLISLIPAPTRPTTINNLDFVNQSQYNQYIWNIKADHAFTPNNRLSFTVTKEDQLTNTLSALPGPLGQGLQQYQRPDNWRWNHDLVIKPTLLLHSTFGYTRQRQIWDNPLQKGFASKLGFTGLSGDADAMPRVQFTGDPYTALGVQDGKVGNGSQINITYHFAQNLSWLHNKHEFKFGWEIRRLQTKSDPVDIAGANGLYIFSRSQTASPSNLSSTGNSFASMLLGLPDSANRTALPVLVYNIRYGYHAAYFQDNWRLTPRLTLNLGLRYDLPIGWHNTNGDYSGVDLTKSNPAANNLPGAYVFYGSGAGRTGQKRPYPTDLTEFGPRLGFSYRAADRTVIRGGWGLVYQTLGNGGCGCRNGFANPIQINSNGLDPALQWDQGIPTPASFRPPPILDPSAFNFQSVDVFSNNYGKAPKVYNWSIGIQHEIKGWLADASYVGSRGRGLNSTLMLNQVPTSYLSLGPLLQRPISSPEVIAAGFSKPFPSFPDNQPLAQALRPYPQFADISERNAGVGRTWYDSLQTRVERRFGEWQFMASYTFSKSLGLLHYRQIFSQNFASAGYNVSAQDNYNWQADKSLLPFDIPHVFNILNSYTLPFGRDKALLKTNNVLVNLLVRDWTIASIQQYRSGPLLQVQAPSNTLGTGVLYTNFKAANVGTGPIQTGVARTSLDPNDPNSRWLNAAAFTIPGQYQLGNAAHFYSDFRNPPIFTENLSVQKRMKFPIHNDRTVDLIYRADAFNVFNRTNFGNINNVIGNPNFGRPSGPQQGARLITMGLRLEF